MINWKINFRKEDIHFMRLDMNRLRHYLGLKNFLSYLDINQSLQ